MSGWTNNVLPGLSETDLTSTRYQSAQAAIAITVKRWPQSILIFLVLGCVRELGIDLPELEKLLYELRPQVLRLKTVPDALRTSGTRLVKN